MRRARWVASSILALVVLTSGAPPARELIAVIDTEHPASTFVPSRAFGGALDGLYHGEVAQTYTPHNIAAMEGAGLVPVSYRLRTELGVEAWHWNPHGRWSDPAHTRGYWTSDSTAPEPIMESYGYKLPRRGNTIDQANENGYSRIDDGDARTFWKSNPYLDQRYSGEPLARHPHWVVIDFRAVRAIDAVRVRWADPYATDYVVQRWVPADSEGARRMREHPGEEHIASGWWAAFAHGAVRRSHGGDTTIRVSDAPVDTRLVRILMTGESHTALPGSSDPRDSLGVAVRELYAGTIDAHGRFHDVLRHGASAARQTVVYTSSTDPWHRAIDRDPDVEQPGFDRVFRSGLTHGRPALMPVGVLYDTPENAAAELRYLRWRHYPVDGIEMGEEPDGQGVVPEDYGALYLVFAGTLHRADPKVALGAAGFQDMVPYVSIWPDETSDDGWLRRMLQVLRAHGRASDLAFFSFERYPYDNLCTSTVPQLTTAPLQFAAAVDSLVRLGVPRNIPWLMTEFGYSAFAGRPEVEMSGAILDADLLGQFLLAGGRTAYLFGYRPAELSKDESCDSWGNLTMLLDDRNGQATQPVAAYYGTRLVTLAWAQPGDGEHQLFPVTIRDVPQVGGGPAVTAYAAYRPDRRWAVLFLNKQPTAALTVTTRLMKDRNGQAGPTGPFDVYQYSAAQYRWHPHGASGYAAPDRPPERTTHRDATVVLPPMSMTVVVSAPAPRP